MKFFIQNVIQIVIWGATWPKFISVKEHLQLLSKKSPWPFCHGFLPSQLGSFWQRPFVEFWRIWLSKFIWSPDGSFHKAVSTSSCICLAAASALSRSMSITLYEYNRTDPRCLPNQSDCLLAAVSLAALRLKGPSIHSILMDFELIWTKLLVSAWQALLRISFWHLLEMAKEPSIRSSD